MRAVGYVYSHGASFWGILMGKSSAPPPPDYTPIAQASMQQSALSDQEFQSQLGIQQQQLGFQQQQLGMQSDALNWAKDQYAANQEQNKGIIDQDISTQKAAADAAQQAQTRYQQVYQPLEDQAVREAQTYASPEQRALQMGAASSQVAQQFDSQRVAAAQNLESFGIDPSSTRYAALDVGMRTNQAAAQAGAATTAGQQVDATARGLQANAINVGRGLPSDVNAGNNTSVNAGNSAVNSGLATTASGANTMGTAVQYGGLGTQYGGVAGQFGSNATGALNAGTNAIGAWGTALNQGYSNELGAFNANQNSSSGIGSLLGLGASFIPGLAEGGTVPGPLPSGGATRGGAVPVGASPTRGKAVDDVPARLTPGEFVVPRDVVQWKGEEHFQKFIKKAREDRHEQTAARPRALPAAIQPAAFTSRPVHAALPVR